MKQRMHKLVSLVLALVLVAGLLPTAALAEEAEVHSHSGTRISGQAPTDTEPGWRDYYQCECGKFFADPACTQEIPDLEAWKTGEGRLERTAEPEAPAETEPTLKLADPRKSVKPVETVEPEQSAEPEAPAETEPALKLADPRKPLQPVETEESPKLEKAGTSPYPIVLAATAEYKVKHMQEQSDALGTYKTVVTETKTGDVGQQTAAVAQIWPVFVTQPFTQQTITADGETVVEIRYKRNRGIVRFDANGGTGSMPDLEVAHDARNELPANVFTREGYHFLGWSGSPHGSKQYNDRGTKVFHPRTDGEVTTLYAVWEENAAPEPATTAKYKVKHMQEKPDALGTYVVVVIETLTGTVGQETAAVARTMSDFVTQPFTQKTITADGETVVEIRYKLNRGTIRFDANGGTGSMPDLEIAYSQTLEIPDCGFSRDGYLFQNWDTAAEGPATSFAAGDSITFTGSDGASLTLYAQWAEDTAPAPSTTAEYTVKHMQEKLDALGTYEEVTADTQTLNGNIGENTAAVAKAYPGFVSQTITQKEIAEDGSTVVEIKYDRKRCLFRFDPNGGEGTMGDMPLAFQETKQLPANTFTREGYTFANWNLVADGSGRSIHDQESVTFSNEELSNNYVFTLYAQWRPTGSTHVHRGIPVPGKDPTAPRPAGGNSISATAANSLPIRTAPERSGIPTHGRVGKVDGKSCPTSPDRGCRTIRTTGRSAPFATLCWSRGSTSTADGRS